MTNLMPAQPDDPEGPARPVRRLRPAQRITARSPEDLIALAPVVLGFWPEDSVVMLTFGGPRPFHARLGLPSRASTQDLHRVEEALLTPAVTHRVRAVVLIVFGDRERMARAVLRVVRAGARRRGIEVVGCLWADGTHYRILGGAMASSGRPEPVAYDVSHHPFVVEAIVEGRLGFARRQDMVASLEPDRAACAAVAAALERSDLCEHEVPTGPQEVDEAVRFVQRLVSAHRAEELPDEHVARLVWGLRSVAVRDAAWRLIGPEDAADHQRFWARVLPRTPEPYVPAVADLLGFAAWQSGDGAVAWAAVDRAQRVRPDDPLAGLLARALENAIPPDAWPA